MSWQITELLVNFTRDSSSRREKPWYTGLVQALRWEGVRENELFFSRFHLRKMYKVQELDKPLVEHVHAAMCSICQSKLHHSLKAHMAECKWTTGGGFRMPKHQRILKLLLRPWILIRISTCFLWTSPVQINVIIGENKRNAPSLFHATIWKGTNIPSKICTLRVYVKRTQWRTSTQPCPIPSNENKLNNQMKQCQETII